MDGRANMQDVFMNRQADEHAPFANKWTYQDYQHTSKEGCVNAKSSEPMTIKDFAHFVMRSWSYDTPWEHASPSSTATRHEHQQQHECTNIFMSSHVMSHVIHISIVGHIFNQCNVTWKSKRPTCCMKSHVKSKSHGIQTVMRVVKQP